jgi:hypothetical protein
MPPVAIASTTPTTSTTTASTPATSAAATPATAVTTAAAAATATRGALSRLIDGKGAPVERFAVELLDGSLRVLVVCKFDECKSTWLTRHSVGDDADTDHLATAGRACLAKRVFVGVIREIPYINASSHASTLSRFELLPLRSFPGTSEAVHG